MFSYSLHSSANAGFCRREYVVWGSQFLFSFIVLVPLFLQPVVLSIIFLLLSVHSIQLRNVQAKHNGKQCHFKVFSEVPAKTWDPFFYKHFSSWFRT